MIIRSPRSDEIDAVRNLFLDEVKAGRMLPRSVEDVHKYLDDWLIAEGDDGQVVGCVSLVFFNATLCEVRSLAVHVDYRGNGLGGKLIAGALALAQARGMQRVLTLTRAVRVFETMGFRRDYVASYPEKVWRDCAPCPLRERCDEVALVYFL